MSDSNGNKQDIVELFSWFSYDRNDRYSGAFEAEIEATYFLERAVDSTIEKIYREDGGFAVEPTYEITGIGLQAFVDSLKRMSGLYGLKFHALASHGVIFYPVSGSN